MSSLLGGVRALGHRRADDGDVDRLRTPRLWDGSRRSGGVLAAVAWGAAPGPGGCQGRGKRISGNTRNASSVGVSAIVQGFITATDAYDGEVTSSATGDYDFFTFNSGAHYLVAYKVGAPDIAGTTVNTLLPQPEGVIPPAPVIATISTKHGPQAGGQAISITGSGFAAGGLTDISIGTTSCTGLVVDSDAAAHAVTGDFAAAGNGKAIKNVVASGPGGSSTLSSAYFTWTFADVTTFTIILLPEDITQSAGVVTGWTNTGTAGAFATQTIGGSAPYLSAESTLNNLPAIGFTIASAQYAMFEKSNMASSADREMFVVTSFPSTGALPTFAVQISSTTATDYQGVNGDLVYAVSGTNAETYRNGSYGNQAGLVINAPLAIHSRWYANGANDDNVVRVLGTDSAASQKAGHTAFDIDKLIFGARWIGNSINSYSTYKVSFYAYSNGALSAGDRTTTLDLIGFLYGVTA